MVSSAIFELFASKLVCILDSFAAHRVSNCDCADVIFFSRASSEPSLGSLFPRELILVTIGSLCDGPFCALELTELLFLVWCAGTLGPPGAISHSTLFSGGGATLLLELKLDCFSSQTFAACTHLGMGSPMPVSYTHLTLPTIYSV